MSRFIMNRQLALILTLAAFLSFGSLAPVASHAAPIGNSGVGPDGGEGKGDPDVPTGTTRNESKIGVRPGVRSMVQKPSEPVAVGDGRGLQTVWMWRLRVVLQGLRIMAFRF